MEKMRMPARTNTEVQQMSTNPRSRRQIAQSRAVALLGCFLVAVLGALPSCGRLEAQTDFFNLDDERPVAIEDALPVERYAFDLELAPARVERESSGGTVWSVAPELAYGILPATDVSLTLPLALRRGENGAGDVSGVRGLELKLFHNFNVETTTLPALAVRGELNLPVGGLAHSSTLGTLKGILTRTVGGARRALRLHANAAYTVGDELARGEETEATRWQAGLAVDRTFVFKSFMIVGNVYANRPLVDDADTRWVAGAGLRYQLNPRMAFDVGVERRLSEEGPNWALTFGTANAFAIRSLIPIGGS
jgi:hypothetical protein